MTQDIFNIVRRFESCWKGFELDDLADDRTFVAESLSEGDDAKFARLSQAIKDQDAAEAGQLFLDMIDEYRARVTK